MEATALGAWVIAQLQALAPTARMMEESDCRLVVSAMARVGRYEQIPRAFIDRPDGLAQGSTDAILLASRMERDIHQSLERLLPARVFASLRFGRYADGFEMDIFRDGGPGNSLNIEIDGPHHDYPTSRRQDTLRDRFLNSRGIQVVRVQASDQDFDAGRIARMVRDILEPQPESRSGRIG